MLGAAHASRYHWSKATTDARNQARGEWQLARVYAVLGRGEPAIYHAGRCLDWCERGEVEDWDVAFANEALSPAHGVAGTTRRPRAQDAITRARRSDRRPRGSRALRQDSATLYRRAAWSSRSRSPALRRGEPAQDRRADPSAARCSRSSVRRSVHGGRSRRPCRGRRAHVVLDDREIGIRPRLFPHALAAAAEWRCRPAADVLERVVGRRGRILVPPVAAAEAAVVEPNPRVRFVAIHRAADPVEGGRRRPVALAPVRRGAVLAGGAPCGPAAATSSRRLTTGTELRVGRRGTSASTVTSCRAVAGVSSHWRSSAGTLSREWRQGEGEHGLRVECGDADRAPDARRRRDLTSCDSHGSSRAAAPVFTSTVEPVRWADLRFSYRAGVPQ